MTTTCRPAERVRDRLGLVRVELGDAARAKRLHEPGIEVRRKRRVPRGDGRQPADGRDVEIRRVGTIDGAVCEAAERLVQRAVPPLTRTGRKSRRFSELAFGHGVRS